MLTSNVYLILSCINDESGIGGVYVSSDGCASWLVRFETPSVLLCFLQFEYPILALNVGSERSALREYVVRVGRRSTPF